VDFGTHRRLASIFLASWCLGGFVSFCKAADMTELEQRERVIRESLTWVGTPYHHMGRIKNVGIDCATFPAEVYAAAGVIAPVSIDFYPPDWHLNRDAERYLQRVIEYAAEVSQPQPGDLVLWKIGRAFAHGAIVLAWPRIIHAVVGIGVIEDNAESPTLVFARGRRGSDATRQHKFFSLWEARS
jgi:cell wall-associated NlpC family hydrolase